MSDSWRARTGPLSILAGVLWLLWVGLGTLAVRLDSDPSVGLWDLLAVQRSESHALWRVARGHTVVGGGFLSPARVDRLMVVGSRTAREERERESYRSSAARAWASSPSRLASHAASSTSSRVGPDSSKRTQVRTRRKSMTESPPRVRAVPDVGSTWLGRFRSRRTPLRCLPR